MQRQSLHQHWTLRAAGDLSAVPAEIRGKDIPATVPGCVHTDLLAAGLIDDPYLDRNELKVQWIGRTDWQYRCRFAAEAALFQHDRIDLVCDGLDTIARVELNGRVIGETANMHHPHRFPLSPLLEEEGSGVRGLLRGDENELVITFASALNHAEAMEKKFGALPHVERHPFNFIRKMACNFGWDWGPALITAGIWRPIYLDGWSGARFVNVRPSVVRADRELAEVKVFFEVEYAKSTREYDLEIQVEEDGRMRPSTFILKDEETKSCITRKIENPELWWPRGHGEQRLYELDVMMFPYQRGVKEEDQNPWGHGIDRWTHRIGLRTVRLNTDKDAVGSKFQIEVNGKPIFCKGANWIPDDCFPHRVDEARYRRRIQQAADANMNMLRVWGGGIYESDTFYNICDELGIMVWQDFLFACAAYPEEEPFRSQVEAEARHNIARLSSHPSLVLWNGCNENIWGYFDWGWKQKIGNRTWGLGYYLDLLPKLMKELDPTRPYWPASPYSGSMDIHPLDDNHGNKHVWDAWNQKDYTVYRNYTPRFVSEFGHQAPPCYATLRSAIPARQLAPDSPTMLHHQKAQGGNDKLHVRLKEHFDIPENFDDWHYLTLLNQARAIQTGVEWWRSRQPVCMGALFWQLNDCWPVTSWAAVDGEGRPKLLWYATRRFFADRLLTIQPMENGNLEIAIVNDTDVLWSGARTNFWRLNFTGRVIRSSCCKLDILPRSCERHEIEAAFASPNDIHSEMIFAELVASPKQVRHAYWYFDTDKNLTYPEPKFDAEIAREGTLYKVKITATSFLRDVCLFVDRLDPAAVANDQLITLLPGESFTFEFHSQRQFSKEAVINPPVFQCANRFGRKRKE